jgi:hypothetical protein
MIAKPACASTRNILCGSKIGLTTSKSLSLPSKFIPLPAETNYQDLYKFEKKESSKKLYLAEIARLP